MLEPSEKELLGPKTLDLLAPAMEKPLIRVTDTEILGLDGWTGRILWRTDKGELDPAEIRDLNLAQKILDPFSAAEYTTEHTQWARAVFNRYIRGREVGPSPPAGLGDFPQYATAVELNDALKAAAKSGDVELEIQLKEEAIRRGYVRE